MIVQWYKDEVGNQKRVGVNLDICGPLGKTKGLDRIGKREVTLGWGC